MLKWSLAFALIGAVNHFLGFIPNESHEVDAFIPDQISEACFLQMIKDGAKETTYERYMRRMRGDLRCYETDGASPEASSEK